MTLRSVSGQVRALSLAAPTIRALADGGVSISGPCSVGTLDRYKEVIEPSAFASTLATYWANPVVLWNHDPALPIGKVTVLDLRADGLYVSAVIVPGTVASDEAIVMVRAGVTKGFSIGFRETDGKYDEGGIYHITALELYEISVCSIPACREALFGLDDTGALKSVTLGDEPDPTRLVLRRLKRALAAKLADELSDDVTLTLACRLVDLAMRRLDGLT